MFDVVCGGRQVKSELCNSDCGLNQYNRELRLMVITGWFIILVELLAH